MGKGYAQTRSMPRSIPVPIQSPMLHLEQVEVPEATSRETGQPTTLLSDNSSDAPAPSSALVSEKPVAQVAEKSKDPSAISSNTTTAVAASLTQRTSDINIEEIERFCSNIGSQAADARFQLQRQQLQQLRDQISERVKDLEEKRSEYETWLKRRDAFLEMVEDSLVDIISKMRPDAAAAQLALMNDLTAASLVLKLSPRVSSAIMNELPPEKSAELTQILVSAQQVPVKGK
ncbi:hypothetical protein PU02_0150 [Bartonella ancashensis]|uniref:Magnesium transporter MgtE intracellular domain-containing protein n=1 Tax=Bartonella ancashensis TaxID=1318743 RepID=A0A0M4LIN5_9HYPH|nr:hypothetical protein PU02_0150 [Bartonella ancashensis]